MRVIFLLILFFLSLTLWAQESQSYYQVKDTTQKTDDYFDKLTFKERSFFGFNAFAWPFGSESFVDVSPIFVYQASKKILTGGGPVYMYSSKNFVSSFNGASFKRAESKYGARVFSSMTIFESIHLRAELEGVYGSALKENGRFEKEWVPGVFLGVDVKGPMTKSGGKALSVNYNVLFDRERSPLLSAFTLRYEYYF